jgi:two-component sensor histidine kinase
MARRPLRVLLIEDNAGDVRLIREMLAEAKEPSFHLESADCLATGLERLARAPFEVVLLDLLLPDSQGLETFQQVRAQGPGIPIVVLSGLDDEELAHRALQAGAQDYLIKGQVESRGLDRAIQYAMERQRAEQERERLLAQLQAALHEKEVLLREVHHRVKNNLQVISSLLSLQGDATTDPQVRAAFEDSQNRIRVMALIHESLYQSDNLVQIDAVDYLQRLSHQLFEAYGTHDNRLTLCFQLDPVRLQIHQAIPCGLILNELLCNALKHAFPDDQAGEVRITLLQEADGTCVLAVRDTGVGFPDGLDFRRTESLGLQLVCILTEQLGGSIALERGLGTSFTLTFPLLTDQTGNYELGAEIPHPA